MVVYVVTIYVAFFVFLFIVYILATYFFPQTVCFYKLLLRKSDLQESEMDLSI